MTAPDTGSANLPYCPEHGPAYQPDHRYCEECGRELTPAASAEPAAATWNQPTAWIPAMGASSGAPPPPAAPASATAGPAPTSAAAGPAPAGPDTSPAAGSGAAPAVVSVASPAPTGATGVPAPPWLSSRLVGVPCTACGSPVTGRSGKCEHCGGHVPAGRDRADLDLGAVAAVTDRARRRRNEDAVAIGRNARAIAAVICDGVSTSLRSDAAAHAGAEAGLTAILSALAAGASGAEATLAAGRAAAGAVWATAHADDGQVPPSCTYVSGIVTADGVTIGWIGDSRAYWVAQDGTTTCLTIDDSVVARINAGRPVPPGAELDPTSRALVRWLGADSADADPEVVTFQPDRPGTLVLCSDGLSHYLRDPTALAARTAAGSPIVVAQELTRFAVESGGHDNVAVAVLPLRRE